ncbi:unnamed protein product, partial [Symbiodinium sp. KB8]
GSIYEPTLKTARVIDSVVKASPNIRLATRTLRSDQDLSGLNPEADIFAFCHPSLLTSTAAPPEGTLAKQKDQPNKRQRQDQEATAREETTTARQGKGRGKHGKHDNHLSESLRLLARLLIQHEDQLAALRVDKAFVLFARQDQFSIIPAMYAISQEWHSKREADPDTVQSPLRTLLLACLIKELMQRVQKMVATSEGQDKLKAAGWLSPTGEWHFMKYCHKTKKLIPNKEKASMDHSEVIRLLTFLLTAMQGDIIHKFCSTRPLKQLEPTEDHKPQAVFLLEVGLRGEKSWEVHEAFCTLSGLAAWQLIGLSVKRETLQRTAVAKKVANLLHGR